MNRKSIRNLLLRIMLFPVFMGFAADSGDAALEGSEGGEETPLPETTVSELARPEGISADEWEGFTEEERQALSITPEQLADEEATATGEVDQEGLDALLEEEGETGANTELEAETATETAAATGDLPSDEDLLAFRPTVNISELAIPKVEVPDEIKQKLTDLDAKEEEAEQLFEEGDKDGNFPTKSEHRQKLREIKNEREALNREANDAVFDLKQQAIDGAREKAESDKIGNAFLAARPYYEEKGTDGETTMKSDALYESLKIAVGKITKANPNMPFMQRLMKADKAVREIFGMEIAAAPAKAPEKKAPVMPAAPKPKVQTLSQVPIAQEQEQNPYAALNKLPPEKLQEKLELMTEKQRDAYYRSVA